MPLVPGKCPQCGATLSVDDTKDAMICNYCGTPYIVEKAIQQFNNQFTFNINAKNVNIGMDSDFKIVANTLVKYNGSAMDVVIPDGVTIIGKEAFKGLNIASVAIPNTVTTIETEAFMDCRKLTSISIPDSVDVIERGAFLRCTSLEEVILPKKDLRIGADAIPHTVKKIDLSYLSVLTVYIRNATLNLPNCKTLKIWHTYGNGGNDHINELNLPNCEKIECLEGEIDVLRIPKLQISKSGIRVKLSEHVKKLYLGQQDMRFDFTSVFYYKTDQDTSCCLQELYIDGVKISSDQLTEYCKNYEAPTGRHNNIAPFFRALAAKERKNRGRCPYCGGETNIFRSCKDKYCKPWK